MLVSSKYKPYVGSGFDFWYLRGHHSAYAGIRRYHKRVLSHRVFRHRERRLVRLLRLDPEASVVFEPVSIGYIT